jgi:hypothetical protein
MCFLVSRLFWVSSLAYPNLLRTKGYVVVVVVAAAAAASVLIASGKSCLFWDDVWNNQVKNPIS